MQNFDINSRSSIVAIVYLAVVGPCLFILQPGYVQGLVQYVGLTEQQAGYIASAEVFGIALTTVLLIFGSARVNWKTLVTVTLVLSGIGNLASWGVSDAIWLGVIRFATGMGSGGVISITFTMMGLTRQTDRNFGYMIFWVLLYGGVGLLVMPTIYHAIGINGLMVLLALFNLSGLLFVRYLPERTTHVASEPAATQKPHAASTAWLTAVSYFVYCIGIGVVWAYLFLVGVDAGVSEQTVASWLTVSQFMGAAGAFLTVLLQKKVGRMGPLTIAILAGAGAIGLLLHRVDVVYYAVAVCGFNFMWNVAMPYFLAVLADFDLSGHMVVIGVAMQMTGFAIGPAIAAQLLGFGGYSAVNAAAVVFWIIAAVLALPGLWAQHKLPKEVHLQAAI